MKHEIVKHVASLKSLNRWLKRGAEAHYSLFTTHHSLRQRPPADNDALRSPFVIPPSALRISNEPLSLSLSRSFVAGRGDSRVARRAPWGAQAGRGAGRRASPSPRDEGAGRGSGERGSFTPQIDPAAAPDPAESNPIRPNPTCERKAQGNVEGRTSSGERGSEGGSKGESRAASDHPPSTPQPSTKSGLIRPNPTESDFIQPYTQLRTQSGTRRDAAERVFRIEYAGNQHLVNHTRRQPRSPNQTKSNQIKPNQTKSNQIKPNQTKSNQIKPVTERLKPQN